MKTNFVGSFNSLSRPQICRFSCELRRLWCQWFWKYFCLATLATSFHSRRQSFRWVCFTLIGTTAVLNPERSPSLLWKTPRGNWRFQPFECSIRIWRHSLALGIQHIRCSPCWNKSTEKFKSSVLFPFSQTHSPPKENSINNSKLWCNSSNKSVAKRNNLII